MKKLILLLLAFNCQAYDRNNYGSWKDFDKDCIDTRTAVLIKQAQSITYSRCNTVKGVWIDVYTGQTITESNNLDIDHVIPLKYADSVGASLWNTETKQRYANDLDNLIATSKHMNRSKGSKGLSKWLPPSNTYKCVYVMKWDMLAKKYNLLLKPEDVNVINYYKESCKI